MNSRDIIIICATVIILLAIGIFLMANPFGSGETAILTMESSQSLTEGDSLILKLSDENKTPIAGQRIEINLTHGSNGITENFTLKTNSNGECKLEDLPAGNFSLIAKYYGNKNYKDSSISGKLTVNKKASKNNSNANKTTKSSNKDKYKSDFKVDDVINGWDPSEHEVSREDLGDGTQRITYDDGYFRIVDKDGNILSYGYWLIIGTKLLFLIDWSNEYENEYKNSKLSNQSRDQFNKDNQPLQ